MWNEPISHHTEHQVKTNWPKINFLKDTFADDLMSDEQEPLNPTL